jgi:hypothetical protein
MHLFGVLGKFPLAKICIFLIEDYLSIKDEAKFWVHSIYLSNVSWEYSRVKVHFFLLYTSL